MLDQGVEACPRRSGSHEAWRARSAQRVSDPLFTFPERAGQRARVRILVSRAGRQALPGGMAGWAGPRLHWGDGAFLHGNRVRRVPHFAYLSRYSDVIYDSPLGQVVKAPWRGLAGPAPIGGRAADRPPVCHPLVASPQASVSHPAGGAASHRPVQGGQGRLPAAHAATHSWTAVKDRHRATLCPLDSGSGSKTAAAEKAFPGESPPPARAVPRLAASQWLDPVGNEETTV